VCVVTAGAALSPRQLSAVAQVTASFDLTGVITSSGVLELREVRRGEAHRVLRRLAAVGLGLTPSRSPRVVDPAVRSRRHRDVETPPASAVRRTAEASP
jgi:hypothetical protein